MKRTTEKNLMVFSGQAHPVLSQEVADGLGTNLVPQPACEFANSEIYIRYEEAVRGCSAATPARARSTVAASRSRPA